MVSIRITLQLHKYFLGLESLRGVHINLFKDTGQPKKTSDAEDTDKTEPYAGTHTFQSRNRYAH